MLKWLWELRRGSSVSWDEKALAVQLAISADLPKSFSYGQMVQAALR